MKLYFIPLYIAVLLAVPLVLVVGSIRLLASPLWLTFEYTRPQFPLDSYGMTTEGRLDYGLVGLDYLLNGEPIEFLAAQRLPGTLCYPPTETDCPVFIASELKHMEDVKNVLTLAFVLALGGAVLLVITALVAWRNDEAWQAVRLGLRHGAGLLLLALVGIVTSAVIAWDTFFTLFHNLFFAEGSWQFFYSDTLIRLYPEQFWFDSALVIGGLSGLGALAIMYLTRPIRG